MKMLSQKKMDIIAFYVSCASIYETAAHFQMDREELRKWLEQPEIKRIKRSLKQGFRRSQAKALDELEELSFAALRSQLAEPRKGETRAAAAKIALDEKFRRNAETELAEVVDNLTEIIEQKRNNFMELPEYNLQKHDKEGGTKKKRRAKSTGKNI